MSASSGSNRASCIAKMSRWCSANSPARASITRPRFWRSLPRTSLLISTALWPPSIRARRMARPETPKMSLITPGELDVRRFQQLDRTAALGALVLDQRAPVAGQIAKLTDRLGRDKAAAHQTVTHQIGQPLGFLPSTRSAAGLRPKKRGRAARC
jgi:hypothetical protein